MRVTGTVRAAARGHRQRRPRHRRRRDRRLRGRDPQRRRAAALPGDAIVSRRDGRQSGIAVPLRRPAARAHAAQPAVRSPVNRAHAQRRWTARASPRSETPILWVPDAGGLARVRRGAEPRHRRQLLLAAAVAADRQAAADEYSCIDCSSATWVLAWGDAVDLIGQDHVGKQGSRTNQTRAKSVVRSSSTHPIR